MELLAFPRGARRAAIGEGEQLASREVAGGWTLRVRGRRRRDYALQASLGTLRRPFEPCSVTLDGEPVDFDWDASSRVLRASFRTRRGAVAVRACPS